MVLKFSSYFSATVVNVGLVLVEVAMRQIFLQVPQFSATSIIPPILYVHSSLIYY